MTTATIAEPLRITPADVARIMDLYQQGLYLRAHEMAQRFGPLKDWKPTPARVLAGRLAFNLGAPRLACLLHTRAWRADPGDGEARYYYARTVFERRGPLTAWKFLKRSGDLPDATAEVRADWYAFHACVLGRLRDFDAAESWLARAEAVCPGRPWICVEQSYLLEQEDCYEDALAAARRSLELRPWYRPGVQAVAHTLQLLNRDDEALQLLMEANERLECGPLAVQLATLQMERRQFAEAVRSFDRYRQLSPLLEKELVEWLAARQSDATYGCGDDARAAELARQVNTPFYLELAEKLETVPRPGKRVLLDVGFVRQHHQTCAPATLAAISRFWKMPANHLDVAEAICFDGTPDFRERHWAEQNGWHVREFTLTWESAVALIDHGVPFTLTTVEPGNAHLQAVIGYDSCRGTLLIRDPFIPVVPEFIAGPTLARYRATGPRGMALVPLDRAERLGTLVLPDAELYDHLHLLQIMLQDHDRIQAAAAYERLREVAPQHRLTLQARRLLAIYDADRTELLASLEALLQLFPDEPLFQASKLACLRELARRDERLEMLRTICGRRDANPIFLRQLAQELLSDARTHAEAYDLLRGALRRQPLDVGHITTLANLFREQRRYADALELDRFATCLDDKNEGLAQTYFWTSRFFKQIDTVLQLLEKRFRRFAARAAQPTRTLYWAYETCERTPEAFAILDAGLAQRPDDGDLALFAANAQISHGRFDRAETLLKMAEGHCPRPAWLRSAARLAEARGEPKQTCALWREAVAAEPLNVASQSTLVRLLTETEGRSAALEHLRQASERFPNHYGLLELWITWLRDDGPVAQEPILRRLLEVHPADAWARRELALALSHQGRLDEAFAELEMARVVEPASAFYFVVLGQVYERSGRRAEAQEAYRQAILLSVDNEFSIGRLIDTCETRSERLAALAFVEQELIRQVIFGDGLLAYQLHAQRALEPEEVLASLRKALEVRPDLWHAWAAVVRQLTDMERLDEAAALIEQATVRFPLLPRLWMDRALVYRATGDHAGQEAALRQALQINPGWGYAIRELVILCNEQNRFDEARALLDQSFVRNPLDAANHGCLANLLWRNNDPDATFEELRKALLKEPSYDWAWKSLREWSHQVGRAELAEAVARELTTRRSGEARSWLMLAETLTKPEQRDDALVALQEALRLSPRSVEGHDRRAELLALAGRFDEALASCRPASLGEQPLILRGREAWVEAERGNLTEALRLMRAAVTDEPDYSWGWSKLVDWYRQVNDSANYLEAAENLVRLSPHSPVAFGYRGDARLRQGDRKGAKDDFAKSIDIAPDYAFGAQHLFDEQYADEEWDAAAQTLALLQKHADDEFTCARTAHLAARRQERAPALDALRRLCTWETQATWPLESTVSLLLEAGWAGSIDEVLRSALDDPKVNPLLGKLWAERSIARRDWSDVKLLESLLERGAVGQQALEAWVRGLGQAQQSWKLRRCLRRFEKSLRASTSCWGIAGYALTSIRHFAAAADWCRDWAERTDVQPWMLLNVVIAMRSLGRHEEARRVGRRAVELRPDHTSRYHVLWLAADEAVAGATAAAEERLKPLAPKSLDTTHRYLHGLITAVLDVQRSAAAERTAAFARSRRQLQETMAACTPLPAEDRMAVLAVYRLCVRRLATDRGGALPRLWSWWRQIEPLVPPSQ